VTALPTERVMRAGALVGVVLAGACGGSGDENSRLSRDEFVQRAGEICARQFAAIGRLEERLDPTREESAEGDLDSARFLSEVAARFRELALDLSELEPPADLDARFRATVIRIERLGDDLDRAAKRARAGDTQGMNAVLQAANNPQIESFFKDEGIEECTS
jgi:hypothetical protein